MIRVTSDADRVVVAKLQEAGQDHIFAFWDDLPPDGQKALLAQLRDLDLSQVLSVVGEYGSSARPRGPERVYEPEGFARFAADGASSDLKERAREVGGQLLRDGKVAVVMWAGAADGNGDAEPRGTCQVGPVSGKSLYCLQAEKLHAIGRRHRNALPLLVVTSSETHDRTAAFFDENDYFGLGKQDVKLLCQSSLPVINRRGLLLLRSPSRLATSSRSDGSALTQLLLDENFKKLEQRGIEHVFYFPVDNPLVQIADPDFLGHHQLGGYEISSKTVLKTDPTERVSLFCRCNGAPAVVDSDELSDSEQSQRRADGELAFCAANAEIHLFSMDFLRRAREEKLTLPCHFSEKKVPYIDRRGRLMNPNKPNAVVFETFLADAIGWSEKTLVIETDRRDEFSPIGESYDETREHARRALLQLYLRWLDEAGARFSGADGTAIEGAATRAVDSVNGDGMLVEISPLFATNAGELRNKVQLPMEVTTGLYLE